MADRRTRHQESPRRRKKESTKAIVDQDEVPRTRAPYQPEEIASSYSSSSSYIDISRTYPSNRSRGFGAIRAFFTAPSEHRRRPRRRTSRPYLRGGTSSSSSINTDLAYGTGYIRRRKNDRRRNKGKEREISGRRDPRADRDPRAEKDPDAAILEVGAGLAAIARTQNKFDLAEARKQGIQPPRRSDSSILKQSESNRGFGSSKISHEADEDGWESATDADSEASSVDLNLAYGHEKTPGWGFFRSRPKRKESVVDPALFGPANSLHGVVHEPVGFDDVDYDNLSDYPPPTVAALERQQGYPIYPTIPAPQRGQTYPPVGVSPRRQAIPSTSTSAAGPMQYVYPVPTSDPTRFDAERGSVVSGQDQYGSRPAPVPIQQPDIQIQQPQPKPIVAQSVFEPPYSTRSEPKIPSSSGRTKSSVAGAALAGVAGVAIASAIASDRRSERGDKSVRGEETNAYGDDRRAELRKGESRKQPDVKDADSSRRERRRDRDRDGAEETKEERRERRRKGSEKRREETLPDGGPDGRREDKYADRADDRDDSRRTRKDVPIEPPVDPFQYQVADDAFKTPDGTRNSEPFTGIQRARSPAVVTVERVPHWHRDASKEEVTEAPVRNAKDEKDLEARESQQTEREAEKLYKEIEHSTIPVESTAVSVAVMAEENRRTREVRKRRYDRSGDSSPKDERDPIQEEADRIYREAVLARKLAESNNDDTLVRIVTPPEMAHKKDKEVLYPVPNADFQLDHVMDPVEFMASPIKGQGDGFDRIKSISGVAGQDLNRPLLTLVRPTPTPSPAPEEQKSRSKRQESSRGVEPSESKTSESDRKRSSRDRDHPESTYRESEQKEDSRDRKSSEAQKTPAADAVVIASKGDATQTPTSANGTKSVTWGENDTREINAESPYEVKDDPISSMSTASDTKDKPKMSNERKASAWGALRGAFMSGAAADIVAKATETSKNGERESDKRETYVKQDRQREDKKPERKESSRSEPFEYRGITVEPEHSDNDARERGPPAVGPKPAKSTRSNMPGAFDDDLDFTATVAAGLQDSGFDPDIVIKDPKYRRRSSPPGSEDPPLAEYKKPYEETVSDISQYGTSTKETSRDLRTRDLDLSGEVPGTGQLVEEPESLLESSKSNKKDRKRDKSKKSKDSYDEVEDRGSKKISVPVDAFNDVRAEVAQEDPPEDWNSGKKSKRKSKRDSDRFDSPSRSMSASDMTSSVEQSKKKPKDRSSKRSSQYDSEPNPEDVPLPSASEISRDDDYDSRKPRGSAKKGSSTSDPIDRDSRSVKSDSSRYADEDDSRSGKKDKRNSGFFSGIFGSSTSKSDPEPERLKDVEEPESKKKKKSKRNSTGNGSEVYGADPKGDIKASPNGNGYNDYDVDDGDPKRSVNGDTKRGKTTEKEESFLDKAGPLGAGAGLAAAIAIAAQHQHSKAAKADTEDLAPQSHTPEHTPLAKDTPVETAREVFEENIVDPDIVQRKPRPSVDPQYGDFLPLPPSNPGSPNVEPEDTLPSLPETPPGTPPKIVDVPARDRSVGSSRRNELPALVKTPSHSAIPIKYIMGNRSTPSSPGMVRAPVIASPSSMSPDTLNLHRIRPRPTSWDSTKEIQPLYLLDPSRRAPASQSTDSELHSPVADEAANPSQIDSLIPATEVLEEATSSDIRSLPEDLQVESSDIGLKGDNAQSSYSPAKFPDFTTLPPLPISPISKPIVRELEEPDHSSLPPLPRSEASTPVDTSDVSRLPQLPDSPSSPPVEDSLRHGSERDTAGVLMGAALGLSAGAIALTSIPEKFLPDEEPRLEVRSIEDLPAEFQIEPITKDRSSYLFQATPPAKRANDLDIRSGYVQHQDTDVLPRSMGEIPLVDDVLSDDQSSPIRVRSVERNAALQALTTSIPEEKEELETTSPTRRILTDGAEPDDADEPSFTKQKKNKKKDKRRQASQIDLEDNSSSNTPAFTTDNGRDSNTISEFSPKKSKKEKKKDKKRGSTQTEAEDVFSDRTVTTPTMKLEHVEGDFKEEPSQLLPLDAPPPAVERTLDSLAILEDYSVKGLREEDDGGQAKSSGVPEIEREISPPVVLSPPFALIGSETHSVDESSHPLLPDVSRASTSEPPEDLEMREASSIKNVNIEALDDAKKDVSLSTGHSPSFGAGPIEADSSEHLPGVLSDSLLASSAQVLDDVDIPEESSPKISKKGKKKDKKRAIEEPEAAPEPSLTTLLPSSIASAIQDPVPSDDYSVKTSKKDKKKDRKNRKSLSRSSTIVEPVADETTQDVDQSTRDSDESTSSIKEQTQATDEPVEATRESTPVVVKPPEAFEERQKDVDEDPQATEKDLRNVDEHAQPVGSTSDDISKAEGIPLPVSRTNSRTGNESELGDVDVYIRDVSPNQDTGHQPAVMATETTSTKESENDKEKNRELLRPSDVDEPSSSEAVAIESNLVPIKREADALDSEFKNSTSIPIGSQTRPQTEMSPADELETEQAVHESKHSEKYAEPTMPKQVDEELVMIPQLKHDPLKNKLSLDEPAKNDEVQTGFIEPDLGSSQPDKSIEKEDTHEISSGEIPLVDEPIQGAHDLGIEDHGIMVTTANDTRGKDVEPFSEPGKAKDSKKSKKKKGKYAPVTQNEESSEPQPLMEPSSEPTTAAASEREDLSGFSTPTSKGKGKKKQKRKSIAWDLPEAETESQPEITKSILNTNDTPEVTLVDREVSISPRLNPAESSPNHDRIEDELDHVQGPTVPEEEFRHEPEIGTTEPEERLPHASTSTLPAIITESKISSTAQTEYPAREYFPSATALHSPQTSNESGKPVDTGYFPSAARVLPAAAAIAGIASASEVLNKDHIKELHPQDTSSTEIPHEQMGTSQGSVPDDNAHVQESASNVREALGTDTESPSPTMTHTLLEHVSSSDNSVGVIPNQASIGDISPSALFPSPSPAEPIEELGSKGSSSRATALLPSAEPAANLTRELNSEQIFSADDVRILQDPPLAKSIGLDEQSLTTAEDTSAETPVLVSKKDVLDPVLSEEKGVQGDDIESSTAQIEEQLEADREWNAEFSSGKKNSKKNKKGKAGLSRSPTQADEFSTKEMKESEDGHKEIESIREVQVPIENRHSDGLEAGYKEDQVLLAKQLQSEFDSGTTKSKKGKKSRSTSRTPLDYGSGSPLHEEPQIINESQGTDTQLNTEASRGIIPDEEGATGNRGPDGLTAGFTLEQLEAARQMSKEFASGSNKSKKDKKRKNLNRSATDEGMSGLAGDDGSADTSLATTEADSATDSPFPLSAAPTPDGFESSFTTKKGKKGKKRQSLLRSFTQDSEDSAGPGRGVTEEPESVRPDLSGKEPLEIPHESETIPNSEDTSSAVIEEPETISFSTKKGKKGSKKRQSLSRTGTQEETPSFDPFSGVTEQDLTQRDSIEAEPIQSPGATTDDIAILGQELNFSLKKSKKGKGKKDKNIDEGIAAIEDISHEPRPAILLEQDSMPKNDTGQGSLADRIWAGVVTGESIQPESKNSSAESEDALGLHTTKKSKKNQKKDQSKSTSSSGPETTPTDHRETVADILIDTEAKDLPLPRADEVESDQKQPKLFDTWSFSNVIAEPAAQDISTRELETTPKETELTYDSKQEESVPLGHALSQERNNISGMSDLEQHESGTAVGIIDDVETPPPVMPKILAWEDELQPQQIDDNTVDQMHISDPKTERSTESDAKDAEAKDGISKPVSAGILAAGAALLAGASAKRGNESTEGEAFSNTISRSTLEDKDVDSPKLQESKKKKGKRPAKLLDRRSLPEDDLFDDPILWDGAETQKYGDHSTEHDSGDDLGFWSAALEQDNARDESAVDDTEDGPSSMPHKRDRSESLQQVWGPSTVLEHIKTPRKHQSEDVPAAIARDVIMEQEIADEQSTEPGDHNRDIRSDEKLKVDNLGSVSQQSDVLEAVLLTRSEKGNKKRKSQAEARDVAMEDTTTNVEPSQVMSVDPTSSQVVNAPVSEHPQASIKLDHNMDGQETRSVSLSALPIGDEAEEQIQRDFDEKNVKDKHRRQEVYLPFSSTESRAVGDERVLPLELDVAPPQPQSQVLSDSRVKDKHRRQDSYFPPSSTLPIVVEEEYHKSEPEHFTNQRGIDDNNRDSAFVTESPVPPQQRFADDHEYARDSGVHLRDWGDTPVSKEKPHVASADAALARLSWPTVDEKKETVNLSESQRPKEERSPKFRSAAAGVGGAVAVAELAHLAAQSPSQKKEEHRENAKFDRSITPNMGRLQTPDHARYRPGSVDSNRSSGTPPLRRRDRKLSGDLRSLSQRSQANLAKEAKDTDDAKEAEHSPATSAVNINPIANEGRPRVKDMADVYDGYGEGRIGSPMSPTRPHSMRRRQSMQVLDLEARLEQLAAENRTLAEAKELAERSLQSSQKATLALADRDAEVDSLKQTLDWLHREVERLKEVNDGLTSANVTIGRQHNERYSALESQHTNATRELNDLRQTHRGLSDGAEDLVLERVAAATEEKDREILQLRQDLEAAHERIREMQREILTAKSNDGDFLTFRDEDYFDNACQQLCQHVQQWVLRFSKFSDMRACRRTNEINNDKIIDRLDNAVLDGSDVDEYLSDRVKRRDIFMSMTMSMIWEFVFTRYLFGMDREQRQKLKSLEKTLLEVGPPAAVHQWRATTLALLSRRDAFQQQREQDTVAVVQMVFQTLSEILPPPTHLEEQIQEQLMRVMKSAVDLSIEMRTQRAEYMMLPPLQPVYDANGDLASQVQFNAALMNERSGDTVSNEDLEAQNAVVRIVLFPLVVKKGDDSGGGEDEIVVCPAQVLVAKPKRHARGLTPEGLGQNPNHSRVSMQSSMAVDQQVPDI